MLASFNDFFKQIDFLVIFLRVLRRQPIVLQTVKSEHDQQKQKRAMANKFSVSIQNYMDKNLVKKLQIGAGSNPLSGWLNTDIEPITEDTIFLDAVQEFPIPSSSFDYVYCEHMIEHITYKEGLFMLGEIYRVLKPGGKIRISTPDIEKIVGLFTKEKNFLQQQYIAWSSQDLIGLYSKEKSKLQTRRSEWDLDHTHFKKFYPDIEQDSVCFVVNNFFHGFGHKFLYDPHTLKSAVKSVGFDAPLFYSPGESEDDNLRGIETHGRLIGETINEFETLIIEAVKAE
jgi:SAM-dependent methyltransferase